MDGTMSLIELIKVLGKRWRIVLLSALSAVLISGFISYYLMTPKYQASTQILVNQKSTDSVLDTALLQSNLDLINTYSVIIKSPAILEKVIDKLKLKQTVDELNENISINSEEGSQVFSLSVQDYELENAVNIANSISETFQQEIKGIMNVDNVSILARAEMKKNAEPISPSPFLIVLIAGIMGLMIGFGISILLEFMDNSLRDEQDVAEYLGLPVLGSIQEMPETQKKGIQDSKIQKTGSESIVTYTEK